MAWFLSVLGMMGWTEEEPVTGWRKVLQNLVGLLGRTSMFFIGFHSVTYHGRQCTTEEAPILVVAPHTSFFDAFPIHYFKTLTLCRDFKLFGISVITFLSKFIVNLLLLFRIKYPSIRNISHKSPYQQDLERECFIKDFSRNLTFKVWSECED